MYFPLSSASDWLSFTYKFSDSLFFICILLFRMPLTSPSFTYKFADSLFFICIPLFRQPLAYFRRFCNYVTATLLKNASQQLFSKSLHKLKCKRSSSGNVVNCCFSQHLIIVLWQDSSCIEGSDATNVSLCKLFACFDIFNYK